MALADSIKKIVLKIFPELSAGYHLPTFAKVVNVREAPDLGDICDEFRPKYAIDVQVLDEYGKADTRWPILQDVMLSLPVVGQEMGFFAYPEKGACVEIAFAYGSPNRPFIRSVLPTGMSLPDVDDGEMRWQHNPDAYQRIDKDGSHERVTDLNILDKSLSRVVESLSNVENYQTSIKETATNDSETIGAMKTIKAFGGALMQSGGVFDLSSLSHFRVTSKTKTLIKSPKIWLGSQDENAIRLMSDMAQLVIDLAGVLDSHTHPDAGVIDQASDVATVGTAMTAIKSRIDGIKE